MPFKEQLQVMRNTNVLIGMHGAGLAFLPFLADAAVVIELNRHWHKKSNKYHYRNLAAWSGKKYIVWQNPFKADEIDLSCTRVPPQQFRALVQQAIGMLKVKRA
jgi:protein O-GlcNAc transferase